MKKQLLPFSIFVLMILSGVALVLYSTFVAFGVLLAFIGALLLTIWIISLAYAHLSKKVDTDIEIQYSIGIFSGIFAGSIVVLADKLLYPKWGLGFIINGLLFLAALLFVYVFGLALVARHVESLKPRGGNNQG